MIFLKKNRVFKQKTRKLSKSIFTKLLVLTVFMLFLNCEKEENIEPAEMTDVNDGAVVNGRFNFTSKESLAETIKQFDSEKIEDLENKFERIYQKGFRSMTPIVNSGNEQLINMFAQEYALKKILSKSTLKGSESDEGEGIIADPLFAVLVNEKNEITVNDTLYKFTKDKGLFFIHIKDSTHLFNFFKAQNKKNNSKFTNAVSPCDERQIKGGITNIDDKISRYMRPIDDEDCDGGGGGGSGNPPKIPQEEKLQDVINGLPVCDGNARGNWVQNIFGKSYVCRNYFDNKHRIKTEFWDQSWLVYKSVGVLTKTQRKRLGVWWASKSDELHLGINRILLRYKYDAPKIKSYSHPNSFLSSINSVIFMYGGEFKIKYNPYGYVDVQLDLPNGHLPFFDFGDDDLLNIYIPNVPLLNDIDINVTTADLTSQSNIKKLYKLGIDFLKGQINNGAKKEFAITVQKNNKEIEVIYFGERIGKNNENYIKRRFYSDVNFVMKWGWNDSPKPIYALDNYGNEVLVGTDYSGTSKFAPQIPDQDLFRDYTHYEIDFYGMARRGRTWKGNRMIR